MPIEVSVVAAFFLSLIGCFWFAGSSAISRFSLTAPAENRWHSQATPSLGGIPIFVALVVSTVFFINPTSWLLAVVAIAGLLMIVGTVDDLRPISPQLKFAVQLVAVVTFLLSAIGYRKIGLPFIPSPFDSYDGIQLFLLITHFLLSVIWLVGIINAINLLDNMDGLAGGVSLVAFVTLGLIFGSSGEEHEMRMFYFVLAGALSGFLVLNIHPAKLFMGDAGALWVGFFVGAGTLLLFPTIIQRNETHTVLSYAQAWFVLLCVCSVPVSDTLMVMITRKLRGQAISVGGKDHLSHRLVAFGFSDQHSVALLWAVSMVGSVVACIAISTSFGVATFLMVMHWLTITIGIVWLTRVTVVLDGKAKKISSARGHSTAPEELEPLIDAKPPR